MDPRYAHYRKLLNNSVTASEVSDPFHREAFRRHTFQVINPDSATVEIQGSLADSPGVNDWTNIVPAFTSSGIAVFEAPLRWVRAKRDNTTKPVTVIVASF